MSFPIFESGTCRIDAEPSGLWIRRTNSKDSGPKTEAAGDSVLIQLEVEQALELGLAESVGIDVQIPWERIDDLIGFEISLPLRWTEPSPFMLTINRVSDIGRPNFRYRYGYQYGGREAAVERIGYFVRGRTEQVYHLDSQTFALAEAMDVFNALDPEAKTKETSWLTFATIKGCAATVGASLDRYLQANDVVIPSRLGLNIHVHEDDSISFVPRCPELPQEDFERVFLRNVEAEGVYSIDRPGHERIRVVLDERQREVLRRMKQARRLSGEDKKSAIENPAQFFDGVQDAIDITYGRRVIGIGEFAFSPVPADQRAFAGFLDVAHELGPAEPQSDDVARVDPVERKRPTAIHASDEFGHPVRIDFADTEARAAFAASVTSALQAGNLSLDYSGHRIAISPDLLAALDRAPIAADAREMRSDAAERYLLIYTDEEDVQKDDLAEVARAQDNFTADESLELPASLEPSVTLKPHQLLGAHWLQRCARQPHRRGVLLADDMGLGKTLQVLTHLAWRIENGLLSFSEGGGETPPWRPILIVAPLILVENETWLDEMHRFFRHRGNVFSPVLKLHGPGIDSVRSKEVQGRETVLGQPVLDREALQAYRVVVTNYETVVNYQFSLAQTFEGRSIWSALVTDEAQKYKAMNAKVSVALKALQPDFHIACTGTPVENRLLDLWNIFDTVQPALLGSAREFSSKYEKHVVDGQVQERLDALRERLMFGKPQAFLIRRDKNQLAGLPDKQESVIDCEMSVHEVEEHLALVAALRAERRPGRHLAALQRLYKLYQHPALISDNGYELERQALLSQSAKLRAVVDKLHEIRGKREKVIIFTGSVRMQQILAFVLGEEFDLRVQIINGGTAKANASRDEALATRRGRDTRRAILQDFRAKPGFHVLVLSPFVAGVGLTITEANHVIHYGRWWNPAVEDQATDRVYRIGQEKSVRVHVPILNDPTGRIGRTFDQRLHDLMQRKRALRADFLRPQDDESMLAAELCSSLFADATFTIDAPGVFSALTATDVADLDAYEFEALIACLFDRQGYRTVLTPNGNDGGADVIAVREGNWTLVQAKHSRISRALDESALQQVLAAGDLYTERIGPGGTLRVITNGTFNRGVLEQANRVDISLLDGPSLLQEISRLRITRADVYTRMGDRAVSFEDVIMRVAEVRRTAA